jgi:hypothetical protein
MKNLFLLTIIATLNLCVSGFGSYVFDTTIQQSFFYNDSKIKFAIKYTNRDLTTRLLKLNDRCHASFRVFDNSFQQVYPLSRSEVLCNNYFENFVYLAPKQSVIFRFTLDANLFKPGEYYVQGLLSNFAPGKHVSFEIVEKPTLIAGLNEACGTAINKPCAAGLTCNLKVSRVKDMGVCVLNNTAPIYNPKKQFFGSPELSTKIPFETPDSNNREILNVSDLDFYSTDLVTSSDFKQLVFNKALVQIELPESNKNLTKQQAIFLLYYYLYSKQVPLSLTGLFYLDTIDSHYSKYIDAAYSLGVLNNRDKYFNPNRLVTRAEVLMWIRNFLKFKE